jgi:hypothetical protein
MLNWGYVDGLAALYGLGVLIFLLLWVNDGAERSYWWVGIFIGFALGVKLTTGILLPIAALVFIGWDAHSRGWKQILAMTLIALLVCSPWLAKNLLATGDPFYPHFSPATGLSSFSLISNTTINPLYPILHSLLIPLTMTWFGLEGGFVNGQLPFGADIGPLLILFAVPGVLLQWRETHTKVAAIWMGFTWITMGLGGRGNILLWQTRYFFVLFPALGLAVGLGWQAVAKISAVGVRLSRVLGILAIVLLGLVLWKDANDIVQFNPAGVVLGTRTPESYLDDQLGWYAPAMRALYALPHGSRALLLWEVRGFYAPVNAEPDWMGDRWVMDCRTIGEPDAILASWRKQGFTHLLIYYIGVEYDRQYRPGYVPDDWQALDSLLSKLPPPTKFGDAYGIYSLTP